MQAVFGIATFDDFFSVATHPEKVKSGSAKRLQRGIAAPPV
jgi:hypothetical protein